MDSSRWQRIQSLFHAVVSLDATAREQVLSSACVGDTALRLKVESMLREDQLGACVLDRELAEVAREVFQEGDELVGPRQIGRYSIVRKLGEGGMGVVYLAKREDLGSLVAIKVLRDSWVSSERRLRFQKEQRFLAGLEHPAIARLYDADTLADGTPYFAMEYVDGVSLVEYCKRRSAPLEERLRLFRAVCEAVQFAHGLALIHRDLKPANILVKSDGSVRLLDFGIAKQLAGGDHLADRTQGLSFMTPAYAAPEQLQGGPVGVHTDIYSLGVILYELLVGERPFELEGERPVEAGAVVQHVRKKPSIAAARASAELALPPRVWGDLDVLILTAMHPDPARRYRSVDALMRDLDHLVKHEPLEARPDALGYRVRKFVRRNRGKLAVTATVLAAVIGLVVFFTVRLTLARNAALDEVARTQRIERFMQHLFEGGDRVTGPAEDLRVLTLVDRGVREARALDSDPKVQSELFQTLGTIYRGLGRFDGAEALLKSALEKRRSLFGAESAEVAETLVAFGLLRVAQARWKDAEDFVRRAIEINRRVLAPEHPALARAETALGQVLIGRGNYAPAVAILKDAARRLELRGDQALELRTALSEQANAQFYLGNFEESKALNLRILEMDRKNLGEQHANVADTLINLGAIEFEFGRYDESERFHRQALVITERWFGPDHHMTASNLTLLARALNHKGGDREARELLLRALAINERVFPANHPNTSSTLNDLGLVARNLDQLDEAEAYFQRMLNIERALRGGDNHERVGVALSNLATIANRRGDYTKAEKLLRDAIAIYLRRGAADLARVGFARITLGHALLGQKRHVEAEAESRAGYEIMKQRAPTSTAMPQARRDLAELYSILGRADEATRFRSEAAASKAR